MKKGIPGLWRKALFLLSGNSATALLTLARNLLVARMLPVADYGIAATFAITMAVVEMASALGLQQQIIQAKDGDDLRFQAALQGFQVLRGALSAVILLAIAHPLAAFFGIPEVAWAYQVLAVMPLLNALQHFDMHRMQRRMVFGPVLATSLLPAVLSLVLIWPLVVWFGDWRAMLWAIIAQGLASMLMSHLVAERPYRLVLDRQIMARNLAFGWPLLLNTILLFLVFNGEKLIVGRELGMEALGIFAMGMTLTLTPTLVMAKSASSFFLPRLSRTDRGTVSGENSFQALALAAQQAALLNGVALAIATFFLGAPVIGLLLGEKYDPLVPLIVLLGVLHAIRVWKAGPAAISLSQAQTGNSALSNIPRVLALPASWFVLVQGGSLTDVIMIAIVAEMAGYALAVTLSATRAGFGWRRVLRALVSATAVLGMIVLSETIGDDLPALAGEALVVILFVGFFASLSELWKKLWRPDC